MNLPIDIVTILRDKSGDGTPAERRLAEVILQDERSILTVCTPMPDVAGVKDVTVSLPNLVGGDGIIQTFYPKLTGEETAALRNSAQVVRSVIDQLK